MSRLNSNSNSNGWLPLWNSKVRALSLSEPDENSSLKERSKSPILDSSRSSSKKRSYSANPSLNPKSSTNSLVSMTAGNWLGWSSKLGRLEYDEGNRQQLQDNEDAVEEDDYVEDRDDYTPDDNGDEIDDHVGQDRKKSSSTWSFWNSANKDQDLNDSSGDNNNNDKKNSKKDSLTSISNTILNSTPSIPSKQDILNSSTNKNTKVDKANLNEENEDDAVLYKPHDKPNQFKQINTHRNEDLKQNVIVPDWSNCLPNQSSASSSTNSITSSIFGNSSTTNSNGPQTSKSDLKNWRNILTQLSTRLGFNSQSLTGVTQGDNISDLNDTSKEKVEKEFNLLYEKTYKLYGRSLAKLPPHKRACLPNYNKSYTTGYYEDDQEHESQQTYRYPQQTQLEEDAEDPNSISITNDPMGNLLINHKPSRSSQNKPNISPSDIISQKTGPLRKIKKILIIGVHGFFPTKMIRPLIGSPKGTSLKFANEAEKSVIRYCIENNLINDSDSNDISIQKIALEKEGKIFDRVEFFKEILIKWQKELNEADFIFMASHSQGCVVSIMLLANLIKMGILKDPIKKRIGILGMAGINNGPFYGVDKSFFMKAYSAIEHESMIELFELTKFESEQSLVYKESIQIIINANVKICFIGSINDQLVPLYSALASHVFHPNIYRACYIDHSSQTPKFIQKLVSLCCHLQNIGYFDSNVLKELSLVLAGPLTGGGHSKIYNDGKVYDMGLKFVLDTDDIVIPPTFTSTFPSKDLPIATPTRSSGQNNGFVTSGIGTYGGFDASEGIEEIVRIPITNQVYIKEYNIGKIGTNPFLLPWCLRGLLFNIEKNWPNNNKLISVENARDFGKNGYDEINELYQLFDNWKPDSKILKDLKFRLNGIRASKL